MVMTMANYYLFQEMMNLAQSSEQITDFTHGEGVAMITMTVKQYEKFYDDLLRAAIALGLVEDSIVDTKIDGVDFKIIKFLTNV
jgi:hypothetical protein